MGASSNVDRTDPDRRTRNTEERRKPSNSRQGNRTGTGGIHVASMAENIRVEVRVRPLQEREEGGGNAWEVHGNTLIAQTQDGKGNVDAKYAFDRVFDVKENNLDVYEAKAKELVRSVVDGFNATVFAYGQTSSGKTYTMMGAKDAPGIIPLAVYDVFRHIERTTKREFLLRVSYMEIYNEQIKDLLASSDATKLPIHENAEQGVFVAGLTEEIVRNPEQVLDIMHRGESKRTFGETQMNRKSSRSHTVFRMVVESRNTADEDGKASSTSDAVRVSVLTLVDLAGSERQAKTGADGDRLKEGSHINKSLLCLGTVIAKLSEGREQQGGHIPFRDSKLTRILQPSLGGNAKTLVICNVTSSSLHVEETHSTLRFASRAKQVTNNAKVNEVVSEQTLLKKQQLEIEELKRKLESGKCLNDGQKTLTEAQEEEIQAKIKAMRENVMAAEEDKLLMAMQLEEQEAAQRRQQEKMREYADKVEQLKKLVLVSSKVLAEEDKSKRASQKGRRQTWYPGTVNTSPNRSQSCNRSERMSNDSAEGSQEAEVSYPPVRTEIANYRANAEALRGKLTEAQHGNSELRDEMVALQEENSQLRDKVQSLEHEISREITEKNRLADVEEKLRASQARVAALFEENEGFEAHICDLEGQRRAPLYNKRQEEELRRSQERVQELELELSAVTAEAGTLNAEMEATKAAMLAATAECDCAKATNQKLLLELDFSRKEARRHETDADRELQERRRLSVRVQELVTEMEEKTRTYEDEISSIRAYLEEKEEDGKVLEEKLEEATSELGNVRTEYQESCSKVEALASQVGSLEKALQSKTNDMESALADNESLKGDIASLREVNEELQSKVSNQQAAKPSFGMKSATADVSSLRTEISKLSRELKGAELKPKLMEKEKERICREMDKLKEKIQKQDLKIRTLMQEKLAAVSEKGTLEREAKRLKDQNTTMKGKLEKKEETRQSIEKLKSELSTSNTKLHSLQMDLQGTNAKISDLTEEKDSLSKVVHERDQMIDNLNSERSQIRSELSELQDSHRKLEGEHRVTCTKLEASRKKVEALTSELSELQQQNKEVQDNLHSLEQQHHRAKKLLEESTSALEDTSMQLSQLREKHKQELENGKELRAAYEIAARALAESEASLNLANERLPLIEKLEYRVAELENQLSNVQSKLLEVEEHRKQEGEASSASISELTGKNVALLEDLELCKLKVADLENTLSKFKEEMASLEESRDKAVGSSHAASEELAAVSELLETERNWTEETQAALKQEISDLKAEQINLQIQLNAARDDVKDARNAVAVKEKELSALEDNALMSSSELQQTLQRKEKELATAAETAMDLQSQLEICKEDIQSLEAEVDESHAREKKALEAMNRLKTNVQLAEEKMQSREASLHHRLAEAESALEHAKEAELNMKESLSVMRAEAQQLKLKFDREVERARTEKHLAQQQIAHLSRELESSKTTCEQHEANSADRGAIREMEFKCRSLQEENQRLLLQRESVDETKSRMLKMKEEVRGLTTRERENDTLIKHLRSSLERLEAEKLAWKSSATPQHLDISAELEELKSERCRLAKELKERRRQVHKMEEVYVSLKRSFQEKGGVESEVFEKLRVAEGTAHDLRELNATVDRLRRDNCALREKVEKYRGLYRKSSVNLGKENAVH